jgi:hypothetical protein
MKGRADPGSSYAISEHMALVKWMDTAGVFTGCKSSLTKTRYYRDSKNGVCSNQSCGLFRLMRRICLRTPPDFQLEVITARSHIVTRTGLSSPLVPVNEVFSYYFVSAIGLSQNTQPRRYHWLISDSTQPHYQLSKSFSL